MSVHAAEVTGASGHSYRRCLPPAAEMPFVLCKSHLAHSNVVVAVRLRAVVLDCDRGRTRGLLPHADVFPRPCATERSRSATLVFHHCAIGRSIFWEAATRSPLQYRTSSVHVVPDKSFREPPSTISDELDRDVAIARLNLRKPSHFAHNVAEQLSGVKLPSEKQKRRRLSIYCASSGCEPCSTLAPSSRHVSNRHLSNRHVRDSWDRQKRHRIHMYSEKGKVGNHGFIKIYHYNIPRHEQLSASNLASQYRRYRGCIRQ